MLTFRSLSLTTTGLLLGLTAAAQTAEAAPSPGNADMLSWILSTLLGAAGIVAVLAGIALATVANARRSERQRATDTVAPVRPLVPLGMTPAVAKVTTPATTQAITPTLTSSTTSQVVAPVFATPAAAEEGVAIW